MRMTKGLAWTVAATATTIVALIVVSNVRLRGDVAIMILLLSAAALLSRGLLLASRAGCRADAAGCKRTRTRDPAW